LTADDATLVPAGHHLIHLDEIDSTNEEAKRQARAGITPPVWFWADQQKSGRGRRGRAWFSPKGNLYSTLLIDIGRPLAESAQMSFVTALAVSDLAAACGGQEEVELKWPNDVLIKGQKVAGILIETAVPNDANDSPWLVVGIGVNLMHAPTGTPYPATSFRNAGLQSSSTASALNVLSNSLADWTERWQQYGFDVIRNAWLERARGLGEPVTVRLPDETLEGQFDGLDAQGALRLKLPTGGFRIITAGEVFFTSEQDPGS